MVDMPVAAATGDVAVTVDRLDDAVPVVTTSKGWEVPLRPPPETASVYPMPAFSMLRSGNVATPFTGVTVVVPARVPPPALLAMATVMVSVKLATGLPSASWAVTRTAGLIAAPAVAVRGGCTVKTSLVAATATLKSVADSEFPPNEAQGPARPV